MRCFYCDGKYNVGAQDHPKWKCPKRQEVFSQGWTRSNIYEKPRKLEDSTPRGRDAMRQEVPCGAVTTREEEPLPPMADSRRMETVAASMKSLSVELDQK
ncbi:hypothetical protein Ae201684P_021538 [Aphanomyces euteiches]|nr:hypothetical protein Ae201684P_021538 [Aphanomyces euteiches]